MTLTAQILLILFFAIQSSVCHLAGDSIDLCSNDTVYYDNYTTLQVDECGCELCIRKCCRSGFYYYYEGNSVDGQLIGRCERDDSINFSVPIYNMDKKIKDLYDGFSIGIVNCTNQELADVDMGSDDSVHYYVQQDGSLYYPHCNKINNVTDYCVDVKHGKTTYYYCKDPNNKDTQFLNSITAKTVPLLFLLATALVYGILPKKNIHRRALIFHTLCLLTGSILFLVDEYFEIKTDIICIASGFFILYLLYAALFWMNIMCIDIWLAFSDVYGSRGQLGRENILFTMLSIYGWGGPALYILVKALFDSSDCVENNFNHKSCFRRVLSSFWFYFTMVASLNVINTTLLILTGINIKKAKREAAKQIRKDKRRHSSEDDEKFTMYWNLFCVMGINPLAFYLTLFQRVFQKVGWLGSPGLIIFINLVFKLYGIVIFIVFVCKKRIRKELRERYRHFTGNLEENESSTSTTLSTKASSEIAVSDVQLTDYKNISIDGVYPEIQYI